MKKLIRLSVFACLLLMQGETLWAQPMPFSQMVRHNNIKGMEVITRALSESSVLTSTKSVDNSGKHTFVLYPPTDGSTQYFTCNLGALFSSSLDDYSVKDIYIFEKKCYFCGSVTHRELIPDNPYGAIADGDRNGFIGYFDIRNMNGPGGGTIFMMELPTTDSIMQIVAHHDSPSSYDIFLMAVGYTSNYPNPTCVVELTKPVGGPYDTIWTLNIVQPSCTETYEYLTDIVLTENHVTVASKLEYADDGLDGDTDPTHYLFRLHEAKRNGFYNTILPLPSPSNVYQYDVSAYGVGIGCHHKGNAIRLCPMDHLDLTCFNWGDHSFTMLDPQESTEEYCVWMLSFHDSNFKARKAAIEPATCEAEIICTKELEQ